MPNILGILLPFLSPLELAVACVLFAIPTRKGWRPWAGMVAGTVLGALPSFFINFPGLYWMTLRVVLQLILVAAAVWIPCGVKLREAVYGTLCAYATRNFFMSLYSFIAMAWKGQDFMETQWLRGETIAVYLLMYALTCWVIYRFVIRALCREGHYEADWRTVGGMAFLVMPIVVVIGPITRTYGASGFAYIMCQVYAALCCAFVLMVQVIQKKALDATAELVTKERLWQSKKEQYQISKASIDIINQKCHDLKHQVAALRAIQDEGLRDQSLREMEDAVTAYDAAIQTGYAELDTILTEKSLICEREHIQLTCMADGDKVRFMDIIDLYTALGNALDNAIEAIEQVNDPDKRVIGVSIFGRGDIAVVQVENYYAGGVKFENGLPRTTKQDEAYHGFGVKSIKSVTEKYGGTVTIRAEEHTFLLSMVIPIAA